MLAKDKIAALLGNRVLIGDDLEDPFYEAKTLQYPFALIKCGALASPVARARDEIVLVSIGIFQQRYGSIETAIVGA